MLTSGRRQTGFTLVELMIGSVVGLLVLSGVTAVYVSTIQGSGDSLKQARLNAELRGTMMVLARDIRRAGYWAAEPGYEDPADNPFLSGFNDVTTGDGGGGTDTCITYTYDLDKDRLVGVGADGTMATSTDTDNVEQFGFRLNDGAVQMRTAGANFSCNQGTWADVTDSTVTITDLSFAINQTCVNTSEITDPVTACTSGDGAQYIRRVDITLSGQLAGDAAVQKTITESIRIRNDRYVASLP